MRREAQGYSNCESSRAPTLDTRSAEEGPQIEASDDYLDWENRRRDAGANHGRASRHIFHYDYLHQYPSPESRPGHIDASFANLLLSIPALP